MLKPKQITRDPETVSRLTGEKDGTWPGVVCCARGSIFRRDVHTVWAEQSGPPDRVRVIINSACTVDEAFAESAKCTATSVPGATLVLYDDTIRQIYNLDPPATAGWEMLLRSAVRSTAIRFAACPSSTHIVRTGRRQRPPPFGSRQFGREQTLETLKGSKGTVLLFYRSADWCPYCKGQLIQLQSAQSAI